MLALAGAMTVLFEVAVQIARIHDRKKDQQAVAEGWGDPEDYDLKPENVPDEPAAKPKSETPAGFDDVT
jgi:sec-independent protein translocase protein TatC